MGLFGFQAERALSMNKNKKKFPHAKMFAKTLNREFGLAKSQQIIQKTNDRYAQLFTERKLYPQRALQQHLDGNIIPGIALYQALLADKDTLADADKVIDIVFQDWGITSRRRMEQIGKLPFYYGLLRRVAKRIMRKNFPEQGWDIQWLEVSDEEIAFNMHRCFYLDVLTEYGVPQLTPYYCQIDDLIYADHSPRVIWARTKTLGRGDDCCDFRFVNTK
jgi:hypothetical protein